MRAHVFDLLPAHAKFTPVLQVRVRPSDGLQLIGAPFIAPLHVRRPRQSRPNSVSEGRRKLRHMGMGETFVTNSLMHVVVEDLILWLR
jgi:hypothetical protein